MRHAIDPYAIVGQIEHRAMGRESLEISAPMLAALPDPMTVLFALPCIIPLRR